MFQKVINNNRKLQLTLIFATSTIIQACLEHYKLKSFRKVYPFLPFASFQL